MSEEQKMIQERPLCIFDLETTGLNIQTDQIIEIGIVKIYQTDPNKYIQRFHFHSYVRPTISISEAAAAVHGIKNGDERILTAPAFKDIAKEIYDFFRYCDIGGFNILNFDLQILVTEFERAGIEFPDGVCSFIDVGNIFKRKEQRTLSAAVKFYLEREHTDAHGALADATATWEVLRAQIIKYPDLFPLTIKELALYSNYDSPVLDFAGKFKMIEGKVCYNFGNKRGVPVEDDIGLALWMLDKDFPADTIRVARRILDEIENNSPDDFEEVF